MDTREISEFVDMYRILHTINWAWKFFDLMPLVDMNSPVHSSYGSSSREKLGKPKSGTAPSGFFFPSLFFLVKSTPKTSEIHYLREPCNLRILRQQLLGRISFFLAQRKVSQEVMEQLFKVHEQISLFVQLMGSYPYARSALEFR